MRVAGYLCLSLVGAVALVQPVQAATIQSVQNGSVVLPGGSTFVQVTAPAFNPVTLNRSFLVFNMRNNQAAPPNGLVMGQIIGGGATLDFRRTGTSGSVTIEWYVAEFSSGVNVQRGQINPFIPPLPIDVNLGTPVDLASSFPLISYRSGGSSYDANEWLRAELTNPTTLRLDARNGGPNNEVQWQVIQFTGASVQSGSLSLASGTSSVTATTRTIPTAGPIAAVDTSKSWLLYTYEIGAVTAPQIGRGLVRGRITSPTTLVFDRDATGGGLTMDLTGIVKLTLSERTYRVELISFALIGRHRLPPARR